MYIVKRDLIFIKGTKEYYKNYSAIINPRESKKGCDK